MYEKERIKKLSSAIIVYAMKIKSIYKKIVCMLVIIAIIFCVPSIFCGCVDNNIFDGELLRLHVRANSNSDADQKVKLKVRDAINEYITLNVDKTTFEDAYEDVAKRLPDIRQVAERTLTANGFSYGASVKLANEYFPTRKYGNTVVESGYYDALIVELGSGTGDNWWCVVYPPLCYGEYDEFEYKSFFAELFS